MGKVQRSGARSLAMAIALATTAATAGLPARAAEGPQDPVAAARSRAAPGAGEATPDAATAGFESLDTDRSGAIEQAEARFLPRLSREFDHWDRDHDGALNAQEFRGYMERDA